MTDQSTLSPAFKEGDIFRWRYLDEKPEDLGGYRRYHCKSQIAIFKKGELRDTYWGSSADELVLDPSWIILDFQGNCHEMQTVPPFEKVFYRPEDLMDMNHANNSRAPVYVKVGAARNPEVMKAYYEYAIEKAKRDIDWAHRLISECEVALATIAEGNIESQDFRVYSQ